MADQRPGSGQHLAVDDRLLASWQRSSEYGVSRETVEPVFTGDLDDESLFFRCGHEVLSDLHRTLLDEHFRVEGRRTWFETIEEMQAVLDAYLVHYNTKRPHQGRGMQGRTPAKAFVQSVPKPRAKEVQEPALTTAA